MPPPRIFLSAGDDSGDLHASRLMKAMREMSPAIEFRGVGLERMAAAGLEPVLGGTGPDGAMWLHNVLRAGRYRRLLRACRAHFLQHRPDLVILIDFGGFNLFLARAATRAGIPVLYYILPQVWAHSAYRAKKLKRWCSRLIAVYPFERDFYAARGMAVDYVGHPLFDEIADNPPDARVVGGLQEEFGLRLIGLFPGSRAQEVRRHLPLMLEACRLISAEAPEASFAIVCPGKLRSLVGELAADAEVPVRMLDARATELARASVLCLTKSGTITLEIASQFRPMVIFYKGSPAMRFFASGLMTTPYIGLVNCLAGRIVCPEKLMGRRDSYWLAQQCLELLTDRSKYERCRNELRQLIEPLANPAASARAAQIALQMVS